MKRIVAVLLLCLLIGSGCQSEKQKLSFDPVAADKHDMLNSADNSVWFEKIRCRQFWTYDWAGPVAETKEAFFYIAEDGMWRFDKATKEDALVAASEELIGTFLYDGLIYYCDKQSIYSIQSDGIESVLIWDCSMCPAEYTEFASIQDFQVHDGCMYIRLDGLCIIKYDLSEKISEFLLEDFNYLALCGNICYFCDHANRTFSIYRMDMSTGETTMVRGDRKAWNDDNKIRYDFAASHHGRLFYSIRGIGCIYLYNESGEDKAILDTSELDSCVRILNNPGYENLCYYVDDGAQIVLFEYDAQGNVTELLKLDKEENPYFSASVWVVDSAVFWKPTEDGFMNCYLR